MKADSFGAYLRQLRLSKVPSMTQEDLANVVGRNKMTISQIEQGKNAPPQGDFLTRIIDALDLTDDEGLRLSFLAAKHRNTIPDDIKEYFFDIPSVCEAIRAAQKANKKDADWMKVIAVFGEEL